MTKKKKQMKLKDDVEAEIVPEEIEMEPQEDIIEEVIDTTPPVAANSDEEFLATEWAKQDPDKPDPHLFMWWDKEGAISKKKYEEAKAIVYKKK